MIIKNETSRFVGKAITVQPPIGAASVPGTVATATYTPTLHNVRPSRYVKPQARKARLVKASAVPYAPSYDDIGPSKRRMARDVACLCNVCINSAIAALHQSKLDGTWHVGRAVDFIQGRELRPIDAQ